MASKSDKSDSRKTREQALVVAERVMVAWLGLNPTGGNTLPGILIGLAAAIENYLLNGVPQPEEEENV